MNMSARLDVSRSARSVRVSRRPERSYLAAGDTDPTTGLRLQGADEFRSTRSRTRRANTLSVRSCSVATGSPIHGCHLRAAVSRARRSIERLGDRHREALLAVAVVDHPEAVLELRRRPNRRRRNPGSERDGGACRHRPQQQRQGGQGGENARATSTGHYDLPGQSSGYMGLQAVASGCEATCIVSDHEPPLASASPTAIIGSGPSRTAERATLLAGPSQSRDVAHSDRRYTCRGDAR